MKKYIKTSDGSFVSFAKKDKKLFQPISAACGSKEKVTASRDAADYPYQVYQDRHDGNGWTLYSWYDNPIDARADAKLLRKWGYEAEIRTNDEAVECATSITASTMSRDELIDTLDERFNTAEDYENLEAVLQQVSGRSLEHLDDSDPEEGIYAHFTTDMLQRAYNILSGKEADAHPTTFTLDLAEDEFSVVLEAMENFADPAFTKDRALSRVAERVLRKLRR